jgi:hypothetical protein
MLVPYNAVNNTTLFCLNPYLNHPGTSFVTEKASFISDIGIQQKFVPLSKLINQLIFTPYCISGNLGSCAKLTVNDLLLNGLSSYVQKHHVKKRDMCLTDRITQTASSTMSTFSNACFAYGMTNCLQFKWTHCTASLSMSYAIHWLGSFLPQSNVYSVDFTNQAELLAFLDNLV